MTSGTTGDRRWGTTRRSGMTILGKVAVPKPINLPSQRLENQGLDPNVEIVPKGTLSWGSKSSLNAWGTSSLSPRAENGPGSPSHLSNRPSTGLSVTRPSTADSDKAHDSSSIGWDSNSRPSSASGVFPANQASVALQRPHSADTRPGSSQLSRFAEAVSETSATWGQHGVAPTKKDGFSLTSGDFPSLGAEKESSEKSSMPQDAARPASSSGRSVEEREANVRIRDDNAWRRDNQPYSEDAPRHCREEGQLDSRCSQSYPNANFPHQYDGWRGPPVNNHQGGGWYRGNHPYGAPIGPGGFPIDPFPFCPPQVPPIPGHEAGPRGNHPTNVKMFRPPILDSYVHPRMQTRPGFFLGPVPHEGYYGPPMGYASPSNRDLPFAGRPAGPHAYSQHSGQGGYDASGRSVALEQNDLSHPQERQRQYKVLLKPQDGRFGEDEAKREGLLGNRLPNAENVAQQMQTSKNNRRENSNEASGEVQPVKAENAAPADPSLIHKIEGLNSKTRSSDGWQDASSVVNRDQQEIKILTVNSGNSVNKVSARMPGTGHATNSTNSLHNKQDDPATNNNAELAAISGTSISRRSTQQTQGRADPQTKQRVNNEGSDGWRKTTVMSGSSPATLAPNSGSFAEVNMGDSLDTGSIGKPVSGISVDTNNQRITMRELARQRAQQRQKEEEERARDQRAKALAKLEELNRRSQAAEEGSAKNLEAASNASIPDMPEVPRSLSPVHMAAKSTETTEESGKTSMQDTMTSTEDADYVGLTQQDNLPRHRDGSASNQKRLGYKQKQNIVFEKKMAGKSLSETTTEVFDVAPSPEVSNEGVISHNSDMQATSSVSTESTFTKRKNNRNGKKKHKVEETKLMNTTRAAVGKETKSGDESTEIGRAGAAEIMFGSLSVPSLDVKVPGKSSDQISSSTNDESQSRAKTNSKSQHLRRTPRNSLLNKPAEKFPGNSTVIWAPVHPQQKADISTGVGSQITVPEFSTPSKSLHQGQTSSRSKRVEMERYVAKPIVKEIAEKMVSKNPISVAPEMAENVLRKENCGGEGAGILQPPGSTAGKSGSPLKSRHGNGRQGRHGRDHGSWHQRGSAASTKALEDGQFGTSNQLSQGTANYHTNSSNAHMQQSGDELGQPDLHVASKEIRGPGDHVSHTAVVPNFNRAGQSGGREYSKGKTYASQKRDVAEYEHLGFTPEQKMTSADTPAQSQNRSANVQGEDNQNSKFQKNTGQNRRFGRGHESHGSWDSSVHENMHHHHQRPTSNRGRQRQNLHYEYKPVGPAHGYDGEHNREQLKDSSQTEGPRYREKGHGQQGHGGQKSYQQQRGSSAGRNAFHGLSEEGN